MNKKILLLAFTIIVCNYSFGQYNPKLDEKNGFRTFKFGDLISKYKGKIKQTYSNYYEYTYPQPNSVFDEKWDNLVLQFFDNKLGYIQVQFKSNNEYLYTSLLRNLEVVFGESNPCPNSKLVELKEVHRNQWEGENVDMALFMYNESSEIKGDYYINIIIRNKNIIKSSLDNQF